MRPGLRAHIDIRTVDRDTIRLSGTGNHVLDVLFDGVRVWSFHVPRDVKATGDGEAVVAWPQMMRRYLTGHTTVTVRAHVSGQVLFERDVAFDDSGRRCRVVDNAGRPLATNKTGRLQRTFATRTPEMLEPLLDHIEQVLRVLSDELGVAAFPAYGTLLGAVREGHFIGHDDDADLGYVSEHEHPYDVIRESFRMQRVLEKHGYRVRRYSGASFKVFVEEADGAVRGLDVFGGFLNGGMLNLLGEVRAPFRRDWIVPLGVCVLEGRMLPCPRQPEKLLAAMYGPRWRTPDPAFHFHSPQSTRRRFDGWFRGLRAKRDRWDRFYGARAGASLGGPHDFAHWVAEQESGLAGKQVVDVGCGRGADALWFAASGADVIGYDHAGPAATKRAASIAARDGLPARFEWLNLAELRSVLPTGALLAARPARRIVYARFVANAVGKGTRPNLWRFAEMSLRPGGRLYVEMLTGRRRTVPGLPASLLSPLRPELVMSELEQRGAKVTHRKTLGLEDGGGGARVCRLVVEWPTS